MKKIGLLIVMLTIAICSIVISSCSSSGEGTITRVYQPITSGTVNTHISITFEDGKTAEVVLPVDDKIWNKARNSKGKKVKVKKSGDKWAFVDFTE